MSCSDLFVISICCSFIFLIYLITEAPRNDFGEMDGLWNDLEYCWYVFRLKISFNSGDF